MFVHFHRHCHLQFTYELPVSGEGHLSCSKDSRSSNITSIELPPLSIEIVDSRDRVERCDKSHILKRGDSLRESAETIRGEIRLPECVIPVHLS